MRRIRPHSIIVLLVLLGANLIGARSAQAQTATPPDYVPAEVLVRLHSDADLPAVVRQHRLRPPGGHYERLAGMPLYRFSLAEGVTPPAAAAGLVADARVAYAEPNYLAELPEARQRSSWTVGGDDGPNAYAAQWAPQQLRLAAAHSLTRGEGITIALLDTGVDVQHPALSSRVVPGYDFVDGDHDPSEVAVPDSWSYGHGTHVAGLLALVAPGASLLPIRTLNGAGVGTIWAQVQGLRYAVANGADVINLSYSFRTRSRVLEEVLAEITCIGMVTTDCRSATRPGVVVAAAAGNSGSNVPEYPAAVDIPGVMAVAASTVDGRLADFSGYGTWVKIAAPGAHVISTVPGGGYASWSGTSMATPLAAGVTALVWSARPALTPAQVVARVTTTGGALEGSVRRRVDAASAVGRNGSP
jgi:subtilisin family serine protease